ncbi:MAG: sulfite exporter TauE/SafE family protein, partial [Halovenus sp.]
GLYPDTTVLALSVVAAVTAAVGVLGGRKLRSVVTERQRRVAVLGLLTSIGLRLVLGGLGVV